MSDEITLNTVLEHLSSMEQRLSGRISDVSSEMRAMEKRLLVQIDAIDERLDEIEIETLPKRVLQLEKALRA